MIMNPISLRGQHAIRSDYATRVGGEKGLHVGVARQLAQEKQDADDDDGQTTDDIAGHLLLGGQGPQLALDARAFSHRMGDIIQDLRQVSTDGALNENGSNDYVQVFALDPLVQREERIFEARADVYVGYRALELDSQGVVQLLGGKVQALEETETGP